MNTLAPLLILAELETDTTTFSGRIADFFQEGGAFMVLLALTSVVGVAAVVYKFLTLRRHLVVPSQLASQLGEIGSGEVPATEQELVGLFEKRDSTLARLGALAWRYRGRDLTETNETMQAVARAEIVRLHAGMAIIDAVITVAPMLGLLGTASGLVVVFSGLKSSPDWIVITGGIGRALSTTIVGLVIAIPAIIAQGYFQRRIDTYVAQLEVLLTRVVGLWSRTDEKDNPS